jgi:hypothetical protein
MSELAWCVVIKEFDRMASKVDGLVEIGSVFNRFKRFRVRPLFG